MLIAFFLVTQVALPVLPGGWNESVVPPATGRSPEIVSGPARLVMGDVDGDGLQDALAFGADGSMRLLRNRGDVGFHDATAASGLAGVEFATCGLLVDLDADGALDLFLGSWAERVWRNLGDGTFEPFRPGIELDAVDLACAALDADGDGLVDLHLVTHAGDVLLRNMGAGGFSSVALPGVSLAPPRATGSDLATTGDDADRSLVAARARLTHWRTLTNASAGLTGGGTTAAANTFSAVPTTPASPISGVGICAETIVDQATGACLEASSVPTLGSLYPMSSLFNVMTNGRIGIGTTNPSRALHITNQAEAGMFLEGFDPHIVLRNNLGVAKEFQFLHRAGELVIRDNGQPRMTIRPDGAVSVSGRVGIGTTDPVKELHIASPAEPGMFIEGVDPNMTLRNTAGVAKNFQFLHRAGELLIRDNDLPRLTVRADGTVSIKESLEIRGGADIVERFDAGPVAEPGTVVVIDPDSPGKLLPSRAAYDSKVAGVVSGAGGVHPGICLSQEGALDGETLVAMNGRVYVRATASNGPIAPGDLLTTSDLAGHAMKVTDQGRAFGAVIGKAMGSLPEGEGLVLVLVNLQ